jgi:hypothetical protein
MSGAPYDRTIINLRERPISSDINVLQSQIDRAQRFLLKQLFGRGLTTGAPAVSTPSLGFIGSGFWVRPASPATMQVVVKAGLGYIDLPSDVPTAIGGVTGLDDSESYKPLVLLADQTINVPAADGANPRIDIVEVKVRRQTTDSTSRDVFNVTTEAFDPALLAKTLSFGLDGSATINGSGPINYKTGTPAGVPVAPTTDTGYVKIAEVLVGTGVVTVTESKITDLRGILAPYGIHHVGITGNLNSDGTFTPGITNMSVPPGMQVAVVGTAANTGNIYIIGGMTPLSAHASTHMSGDSAVDERVYLTPLIGTISSGEQTELAGAGASPALNVAIGQPRIKIQYGGFTFSEGTGQITAWAGGSGLHPFKTLVEFVAGQMVVA